MTKTLDDFAIAVMQQGIISKGTSEWISFESIASNAYDIAEAMIKESRKRKESQEQRHTVELTED